MWELELCVLSCIIKLEICRNGDSSPEDMEMREENITNYAAFLEDNLKTTDDYRVCVGYFRANICY